MLKAWQAWETEKETFAQEMDSAWDVKIGALLQDVQQHVQSKVAASASTAAAVVEVPGTATPLVVVTPPQLALAPIGQAAAPSRVPTAMENLKEQQRLQKVELEQKQERERLEQQQKQYQEQQSAAAAAVVAPIPDSHLMAVWALEEIPTVDKLSEQEVAVMLHMIGAIRSWTEMGQVEIPYWQLLPSTETIDPTVAMMTVQKLMGHVYWQRIYGARSIANVDIVPIQLQALLPHALTKVDGDLKASEAENVTVVNTAAVAQKKVMSKYVKEMKTKRTTKA